MHPPSPAPTPWAPPPPASLDACGLPPSRPGLTTCRSQQHPSRTSAVPDANNLTTYTRSGKVVQWPARPFEFESHLFPFDGRPFAVPGTSTLAPAPSIGPTQPEAPVPSPRLPTASPAFPLPASAHAAPASVSPAATHAAPASVSAAAHAAPAGASAAHAVPAYAAPAATHATNYQRQNNTPGHVSPLPRPRPPAAAPTQATARPLHRPLPPPAAAVHTAGRGQLDANDAWWVVVRGQRPGVYRGGYVTVFKLLIYY